MCEPITATTMLYATLAMSAASTAATFVGQQQQANATEAYQNQQYADAQSSANAAFINQASQENLRLQQEAEKKTNEQFSIGIDAAKATSTAKVAAGEAGVSGLSVDALLADFGRSEARYNDGLTQNLEFDKQQSSENMKGFAANRQSRVNQFMPQPVNRPSFLGAALRVGGDSLSAYNTFIAPDKRAKK